MISPNTEYGTVHRVRVFKDPFLTPEPYSSSFFEIICLASGCCNFTVDNTVFSLDAGSLCLIPPRLAHTVAPSDGSCIYQVLTVPGMLEQLITACDYSVFAQFLLQSVSTGKDSGYMVCITPKDSDSIISLAASMYDESLTDDCYSDPVLSSMFSQLMYKLLRSHSSIMLNTPPQHPDFDRMAIISKYMAQNYATASLVGLADLMNYSLSYCSRFVLKSTGLTFKQLQKKLRMEKAAEFLLHTSMNVNTIAETVGYSSPENFMKIFKKEYGLTPTQYRRKVKPYRL